MHIKTFYESLETFEPEIISAGVAITLKDSILLVRSTTIDKWGIPKGRIEEDETILEAALRELDEETGIELDEDWIVNKDEPFILDYVTNVSEKNKRVYIFHAPIESYENVNLKTFYVPYTQLQVEEVDVAMFVRKDEALSLIDTFTNNTKLLEIIEKLY